MNNLFRTETRQFIRSDATIRVQSPKQFKPYHYIEPEDREYISVPLLEYHPDNDNRMKCRGRAYVPNVPELAEGDITYPLVGEGFLDNPYREINEVFIHPEDNRAMKQHCAKYLDYGPIILVKCPLPFPMFKKGTRVRVVQPDERGPEYAHVGELATLAEDSSGGGMSSIRYDKPELNKGFKSLGIASICLREA
jgi:hypothetical protein